MGVIRYVGVACVCVCVCVCVGWGNGNTNIGITHIRPSRLYMRPTTKQNKQRPHVIIINVLQTVFCSSTTIT